MTITIAETAGRGHRALTELGRPRFGGITNREDQRKAWMPVRAPPITSAWMSAVPS